MPYKNVQPSRADGAKDRTPNAQCLVYVESTPGRLAINIVASCAAPLVPTNAYVRTEYLLSRSAAGCWMMRPT